MQYACMGWGGGGERGRNIVAGLTDRNVVALYVFGNVFFFLSNSMIKNENYSSQVLQS